MVVAVLLPLTSTTLPAQRPQEREGFWLGLGVEYGSAGISCENCQFAGRASGIDGYLKMGGSITHQVLVGGELDVLSTGEDIKLPGLAANPATIGNLSAAIYYYPARKAGFFVKGGAGLGTFVQSDSGSSLHGTGFGLLAGMGYDIRVGWTFSITPVIDAYYGHPGTLTLNGRQWFTSFNYTVVSAGVGLTFH